MRLIPVHRPKPHEDAFEIVLDAVLAFDGLLFCAGSDNIAACLESQNDQPESEVPVSPVDWWVMLITTI
ncbi:MAG TPA: hypothetical protein VNE38_05690 [Ktedonobacteraceae bacterium]|nr:hypothetical protein [Ktedonobacteraceae bacterium]